MSEPRRMAYKVVSIHAIATSYGLRRVELAEYDPRRPGRQVLSSVTQEVPDVHPWFGLEVGDVIEVAVFGSCDDEVTP